MSLKFDSNIEFGRGLNSALNFEVKENKKQKIHLGEALRNFKNTNKVPSDKYAENKKSEKEAVEKKFEEVGKHVERLRKKFANKKASNGMKYGDAKKIVNGIMQKYEERGKLKQIMSHKYEVDENGKATTRHYVDPEKLPEPDRTNFIKAKSAINEIEEKYPEEYELTFPAPSLLEAAARGLIATRHL